MPPRVRELPNFEDETMGPMPDMHPLLFKHHPSPTLEERLDRRSYSQERYSIPDAPKSFRRESCLHASPRHMDVTIFVGRNRTPYYLSAESLRGSSFFTSVIEKKVSECAPSVQIVVDCDEVVFQQMLLLLRYNSFDALPKFSDPELFRLKKELSFYGIEVAESVKKPSSPPSPQFSPPRNVHPSPTNPSSPARQDNYPQNHFSLTELPDLPEELKVASQLVLVARTDDDRGRCSCTPKDQHTFWALSFHYRHIFCTGCGNLPSPSTSPRFIAEMYMAAAMYYAGERSSKSRWSVGCDSTCSLKVFNGRSCCVCCCSGSQWAVSTYHSHAFCMSCGQVADQQRLVCILMSFRYGGVHRSPKGRREDICAETGRKGEISREAPRLYPAPSPKGHVANRSLWCSLVQICKFGHVEGECLRNLEHTSWDTPRIHLQRISRKLLFSEPVFVSSFGYVNRELGCLGDPAVENRLVLFMPLLTSGIKGGGGMLLLKGVLICKPTGFSLCYLQWTFMWPSRALQRCGGQLRNNFWHFMEVGSCFSEQEQPCYQRKAEAIQLFILSFNVALSITRIHEHFS